MLEIQNFIVKQFYPNTSTSSEPEYKVEKPKIKIETNFKLPISYLEPSELFKLSDIVSNDLELTVSNSNSKSMYEYLFQPSHQFARDMIEQWKDQYTTNQEYLKDTQQVVIKMDTYKRSMTNNYELNYNKIINIWEDLKVENNFLDRYGYMEWDMLAHLNESSGFLQCLTIMNVLSPAISLFIPILFFIFPFIILKIQGIPISFDIYFMVLKDLARNHFIGKALVTMESLSWDKVFYLLITFGLYLMQIYQNVQLCQNFYKNIIRLNDSLVEIQNFTKYSIESMDEFLVVLKQLPTYEKIAIDIRFKQQQLKQLYTELQYVRKFERSFNKFSEVGYMMKCYYRLYSNKEHEDCLRYAVGFEGYVNNLLGIHENIVKGIISFSEFDSSGNCSFEQQYYPPLMNENPVKNDCDFKKNMIISSPNRSGKTTILKTTTINIIFTQQVGCGFYKSGTLNPYTHIHSYLNIPDTSGRDSLFQAESRRCKEIIDIIEEYNDPLKYRHFCEFDELYSGTNPDEASKAGHAFLKYLTKFENVNFILTTHYLAICKKFNKSDKVQNYKMEVIVLEDGSFEYTYKIKEGISRIKGGVRVLKDMNYPDEIIKTIERQ
jgi:MutS domain V